MRCKVLRNVSLVAPKRCLVCAYRIDGSDTEPCVSCKQVVVPLGAQYFPLCLTPQVVEGLPTSVVDQIRCEGMDEERVMHTCIAYVGVTFNGVTLKFGHIGNMLVLIKKRFNVSKVKQFWKNIFFAICFAKLIFFSKKTSEKIRTWRMRPADTRGGSPPGRGVENARQDPGYRF